MAVANTDLRGTYPNRFECRIEKDRLGKSRRQKIFVGTTVFMILWTGLLTFLSCKGFFSDFSKLPPRPALAILIPLPFVLLIAFSKKGNATLTVITAALVSIYAVIQGSGGAVAVVCLYGR